MSGSCERNNILVSFRQACVTQPSLQSRGGILRSSSCPALNADPRRTPTLSARLTQLRNSHRPLRLPLVSLPGRDSAEARAPSKGGGAESRAPLDSVSGSSDPQYEQQGEGPVLGLGRQLGYWFLKHRPHRFYVGQSSSTNTQYSSFTSRGLIQASTQKTADGTLKEMTQTEHRGGDNFKKNHPNTGQQPSKIDRTKFKQERSQYWKSKAKQEGQ